MYMRLGCLLLEVVLSVLRSAISSVDTVQVGLRVRKAVLVNVLTFTVRSCAGQLVSVVADNRKPVSALVAAVADTLCISPARLTLYYKHKPLVSTARLGELVETGPL